MLTRSFRTILRRASVLFVLPLLFQACSTDSGDGDGDGAIALTLSSSSASVAQGGSTTVPATLTRSGDFTGAVTFSVTGAPTGVTAGITGQTTTGSTTTGTVTIVVAADAAAGTYNLTVKAHGTGVADATAPFTLTITATTAPNYSISLAPATLTVAQGATGNSTATLTRTGGFAGSVNLSLTNAPAGVTASFTPNNTTGNTSAVVVTVGSAVPAGQYTVYVGGVAAGQADKISPLVLNVTAVATASYTIGVPTTATVAQGNSVAPAITLTRTNFTGNVALTATGTPTGLTAAFSPASTTGNASTLTFTAAGSTATGTYPIVIHGASTLAEQTATINVTVTSSGGGGGNASLSFANCATAAKPLWLAFQNGPGGAWTVATPTNDVYSFTNNAGRAGYAFVTSSSADNFTVSVQYYTQAEMTSGQFNICGTTAAASKSYTGTVAGLAALDGARLSLGLASASPTGTAPAFVINNVPGGNQDLLGWKFGLLTSGTNDRGFLRRDIDLATGAALGTLDFAGAESFVPTSATWSTTNGTNASRTFALGTGAACTFNFINIFPGTTLNGIPADIPSRVLRATDYYLLTSTEGNSPSFRTVIESFKTFGNRSATFGTALSAPTVTSLGGSYKRLQAVYTIPNDQQTSTTFQYSSTAAPFRAVSLNSSFGAVGSNAATIAMPDFSGLAGWNNTWAPGSAQAVNWTVSTSGSNLSGAFPSLCSDGQKTISASYTGTN